MQRQKILVGMSGGVDSSVSAALLVEQGHDVEGVFLKVWSEDDLIIDSATPLSLPKSVARSTHFASVPGVDCPWEVDLADARLVADKLGIKLHVRNVQREYFERVVERMKAGYAAGETPNPDVLCNSEIKFGLLYDWAMAQGFDAVATGHYARTSSSDQIPVTSSQLNPSELVPSAQSNPHLSLATGHWQLVTARDELKDQTYFLWRIPRERFEHILFPIGHLQKSEVRDLASDLRLPNSAKPDSQGICFLGHVNVHDWLRRELGTKPGSVVTRDGQIVGQHAGAALATIGQRHGLGIPGGGPVYYVVEKNVTTNTLIVDTKPAVMGTTFEVVSPNWLVDQPLDYPNIEARIRHQGERIACAIQQTANSKQQTARAGSKAADCRLPIAVCLLRPAFAIAPGQSVVFYSDKTVLGGGIIQLASSK